MQEKYEKLFHEFVPQETFWGDWCHSPQAYFRGETVMPGATLNVGFQVFKKPKKLETEPHFHREDEYLIFLGATFPDVFASWDAEVHFYLGKTLDKMEKIIITEPTIVHIPQGWWHCPLDFKRVDKPIFFQAALEAGRFGGVRYIEYEDGTRSLLYRGDELDVCKMDPKKECNFCGYCFSHPDEVPPVKYKYVMGTIINEDGVESYTDKDAYDASKAPSSMDCVITPEYKSKPYSDATTLKAPKPELSPEVAKNVLAVPKEETSWGDWCPSPQCYFRGETYMEGATYHVGYQIFTKALDMEAPHFHHGKDEYIFFMGADPMNIFDFDCEIEFFIGEDPDHMESKIITKPTVVRLPANMWHCPIRFRKMKKPVLFQAAYLDGTWGTVQRVPSDVQFIIPEDKKDDKEYGRIGKYSFAGDNVRPCKFNPQKRCNICGKCFKSETIDEDLDDDGVSKGFRVNN